MDGEPPNIGGEDVDLVTVYTDVYNMRIELEKMKKPVGTRNNPSRSCKDLSQGHPQLKDGFYWVDPNLGMVDDAVKVFCNMTSGETCVYPDVHASKMPNIPWRKSGQGWYSRLRGGFKVIQGQSYLSPTETTVHRKWYPFLDGNTNKIVKKIGQERIFLYFNWGLMHLQPHVHETDFFPFQISYDSVGPVQMRFLRLLSETARQEFTYTCINSVAWYDESARNYQNSVTFLGDNSDTFSSTKNKPKVTLDGCKVKEILKMRTRGCFPDLKIER